MLLAFCLQCLTVTANAEKTRDVLSLYSYEVRDDEAIKAGELKSAKEQYEEILKEVEYLNQCNANISTVNVDSIIQAKADVEKQIREAKYALLTGVDLEVGEILTLENNLTSLESLYHILIEEITYVTSLYNYTIPFDQVGDALSKLSQKAAEYDEAVRYGEIGDVTNVDYPVKGNFYISSGFGERISPLDGVSYDNHRGLDMAANAGTPIGALFSGTVIAAEWHYGMGNFVRIDHGDGIVSSYLHLTDTYVKVGDQVKQYEDIGTVGTTGEWSTGPHLHLALSIKGTYVDPYKLWR